MRSSHDTGTKERERPLEFSVGSKAHLDIASSKLHSDLERYVGIKGIKKVTITNRYLTTGLTHDAVRSMLLEAPVDETRDVSLLSHDSYYADQFKDSDNDFAPGVKLIALESNPGQFDARSHAIELIGSIYSPEVHARHTTFVFIEGDISKEDLTKIKKYLINPQEKYEVRHLDDNMMNVNLPEHSPKTFITIDGFIESSRESLTGFIKDLSLAMNEEDIQMVHDYFKTQEKRNPTKSELLAIDTYWSDHCRHTTFNTELTDISISGAKGLVRRVKQTHKRFVESAKKRGKSGDTFMQLAQSGLSILKEDKKFKGTKFYDANPENNAASYKTIITMEDGRREEWIIMFKNETHNSPTEVEPYGGAATCLGGAIRDTISGRAFTFQAMRVTGSSKPTEPLSDTLIGKLSQRAIFLGAAFGYASYGNQIGLPAGQVREYFHPGYVAKRFECGFVVAGAPISSIRREEPKRGDIVIMFGGKTGRDGVGGAKVSSVAQGTSSSKQEGAHVQKGNAPEERKLQRLFKNPAFTKYVKKCNDFGAGGIAVAIGEIARGIEVQLDRVPRKYFGLTDDELILAESQERMAIVIEAKDKEAVLKLMEQENIEGVHVGDVTNCDDENDDRMVMHWEGHRIIDISRKFLDSAGAQRKTRAKLNLRKTAFFTKIGKYLGEIYRSGDYKHLILKHLSKLENASQRGLQSIFDSSVIASTVLAPYGGKYQTSPQIGMASKIPTFDGVDSITATLSAHATHPYLLEENPYLGGLYAVLESISKIVAMGGEREKTWLSLQEYFGKLKTDENWGDVYAMLLGALEAQLELKVAAIGGKDSASGTAVLQDGRTIHVPPTLVSFANTVTPTSRVVSAEFKKFGNRILYFPVPKDSDGLPNWSQWIKTLTLIEGLIASGEVYSSSVIEVGGLIAAISKMSLGNKIGFRIDDEKFKREYLESHIGGIILEVDEITAKKHRKNQIGITTAIDYLNFGRDLPFITIGEAQEALESPLEGLLGVERKQETIEGIREYTSRRAMDIIENPLRKPVMLIPVFEGSNSEDDTMHAAKKAGFHVIQYVFRTHDSQTFLESRREFAELLRGADMLVFPGGFSAADEPAGSGKFMVHTFLSSEIKPHFDEFTKRTNTLTLGICNGFQALIKLGVFESGEIKQELTEVDETIYYNDSLVHETGLVRLKTRSLLSPFLSRVDIDEVFLVPISHGEGKITNLSDERLARYEANGQIPFQYYDEMGRPTNRHNGSHKGIAALSSPDGRIFGMMPHPERRGNGVFKNVPGDKFLPIFEGAFESLTGRDSPSRK